MFVCYIQLWLHLLARLFALIVIPLCVYVSVFYIHLQTLINSGPHDDLMTSAFQASLQVNTGSVSPVSLSFVNTQQTNKLILQCQLT